MTALQVFVGCMDDPKIVRKFEGSFLVQGDKGQSPPVDATISCNAFVLLADVGTADLTWQSVSEASCRGPREVKSGSKDTAAKRGRRRSLAAG